MKISINKFFAVFSVFLIMLAFIPAFAFAAEQSVSVSIPISIKLTGDAPEKAENYTIKLAAQEKNTPMPKSDTMTLNGEGDFEFSKITFDKPGVYNYKLFQLAGENKKCTYDSTVYSVVVSVTNSEAKEGFNVAVAVKVNNEKYDCAQFVNEYEIEKTGLTVKKIWHDNGKNRPGEITVRLLDGANAVEQIALSEKNDWTYTWKELEKNGHNWNVEEINVPKGYTASYDKDKNVVTITNTYSQNVLIQTGQLNYPIPVLLCAGAAFIILGTVLGKKRNNKDA